MNCSSCGNAVQQGDSFCMHCGAFLPAETPSPPSETTASFGQPRKEGTTAPPAKQAGARPAETHGSPAETRASPPASEPWQQRPEATKYSAPESSFSAPTDREGAPNAGVQYNSSKSRWIGVAVLLVCLFSLAAIGGYLLQRRGAEPSEVEDAATAEEAIDSAAEAQRANAPSPADANSTAATDANSTAAADANGTAAADSTTAVASSAVSAASETPASPTLPARPRVAQSSPTTPPARKPDPARVEARPGLQESSPTPPPTALQTPAANPIADPGPARTQEPTPTQPAETALVAEAKASGDVRRRAPPNTRVLIPGEQPAAANPAVVPDAGPAVKQRPTSPAAVEEGIIYWTGRLQKNQVIVIEGGRASAGQIDGKLPGTPIDVWLPSPAVVLAERPNAGNNWGRVAFRCVQNTNRNVTINVQWKRLR